MYSFDVENVSPTYFMALVQFMCSFGSTIFLCEPSGLGILIALKPVRIYGLQERAGLNVAKIRRIGHAFNLRDGPTL